VWFQNGWPAVVVTVRPPHRTHPLRLPAYSLGAPAAAPAPVARGDADGARLAIRGGSAGG